MFDLVVGMVYSIGLCGIRFGVLSFGRRYKRRQQVVLCEYIDTGVQFKIACDDLAFWHTQNELFEYYSYHQQGWESACS